MKTKRNMIRTTVLAVLACIIITGSFLLSSMTSNAVHLTTCNQVLYRRPNWESTSSYTHASQYGTCYVSVKEVYIKYSCNCEDSISLERISRQETHSQPHG